MDEQPELKIKTSKPDKFKTVANALDGILDEVTFTADKTGLSTGSMDPANVCMVSFAWDAADFDEYEAPETPLQFCMKTAVLKAALKRVKSSDSLSITATASSIKFVTDDGASKKTQSMRLLDVDTKERKIPNLVFSASAEMPSDRFASLLEEAGEFEGSASFTAGEEKLTVEMADDDAKNKVVCELRNGEKDIKVTPTPGILLNRARYASEYLKKMTSAAKGATKAKMEWGKDYPCKITYECDKLVISYILAPRVENE